MKRFEIPESMKVASIWVVWGFLAIGTLGSALFVVLDYFGVKEQAAAWVQAVGSIGAIVAAGFLPLWHSRKLEQRETQRLKGVIGLLANDHCLAFFLLNRALNASTGDYGSSINSYQEKGYPLDWETHLEALASIDLTKLEVLELRAVNDMKMAARYAVGVVAELMEWDWHSDTWRERMRLIERYYHQAMIIEKQTN